MGAGMLSRKYARKNDEKLTAKGRDEIKGSNFALPDERKYPIHDIEHARNALARVAQNGTPDEQKRVKSAVHKKYPNLADKK